jgi:hypothetical protein
VSSASEQPSQYGTVSDLVRTMRDVDPLATMPMRGRGPVEPTDFLVRLEDAMRASAATLAWLTRTAQPSPTPDATGLGLQEPRRPSAEREMNRT